MNLETLMFTMADGRKNNQPIEVIARRMGINVEQASNFERNFIAEFLLKYRRPKHGDVGTTAEELGWPTAAVYFANSVYGFSSTGVNGHSPIYRKIIGEVLEHENLFVALAKKGARLSDLGALIPGKDNSRSRVQRGRNALMKMGLFNNWREVSSRLTRKQKPDTRAFFLGVLAKKARMEDPYRELVLKHTEQFLKTRDRRATNPYEVEKIFRAYFNLQRVKPDESISVGEVERATGLPYDRCIYVLQEEGIELIKHRRKTDPKEIEAIRNSPFTGSDVLALTDLSMPTIRRFSSKLSLPNDRYFQIYSISNKKPQFASPSDRLRYRDASEIYEAQDAGFSRDEIKELTGKADKIIEYALEHRSEIEKPIINFLRTYWDVPNYDKPYRGSELNGRTLGKDSTGNKAERIAA